MKPAPIVLAAASFALASVAFAQQNPRGTAETTLSGSNVSVEYGRPSLKGRDMLAQAPVGTVWRTGADTSTTFTTETDLAFGDTTIPAGSYSLFTERTYEDSWRLIFNAQTGQWGTQHDATRDVASVPLEWNRTDSGPEQFTIELSSSGGSGELRMLWGTHVLSASFEAE